jgi:hypothetical protein
MTPEENQKTRGIGSVLADFSAKNTSKQQTIKNQNSTYK